MLLMKGKIVGVKEQKKIDKNTGEEKIAWLVGFSVPRKNGYDGQEDITEVRISKTLVDKGLPAHYQKLVGQEVTAPVFVMPWSNGQNVSYFFENEGKPIGIAK